MTSENRKKKVCNACRLPKILDEFNKNKQCRDGHEGTCKACKAEKAKERYHKKRAMRRPTAPVQKPAETPPEYGPTEEPPAQPPHTTRNETAQQPGDEVLTKQRIADVMFRVRATAMARRPVPGPGFLSTDPPATQLRASIDLELARLINTVGPGCHKMPPIQLIADMVLLCALDDMEIPF